MKKTMNLVFLLTISSLCMPAGSVFQPVMPGAVPESPITASPLDSSYGSPESACSHRNQLVNLAAQQKARTAKDKSKRAKQAALEASEIKDQQRATDLEDERTRRQEFNQIRLSVIESLANSTERIRQFSNESYHIQFEQQQAKEIAQQKQETESKSCCNVQ